MRIAAIGVVLLNSEQGKKACRARGDAPDGTASWQQVGVTGQREPVRLGPIIRRQVLARECGGEHHRPAGLYAKIASVLNHPQRPLLAHLRHADGI
jgi:hypothetical protein